MRTTQKCASVLLALLFITTAAATIASGSGGEEGQQAQYHQNEMFIGTTAYIPVDEITGIPSAMDVGTITLEGVVPASATDQMIKWNVREARTTGASMTENTLTTIAPGMVTVTATLGGFVMISVGDNHNAAIKDDGTLWTWGYNGCGQLGDGTTTDRKIPVQVGTDDDWATVSAGIYHTVAIKTDGTMWAWGHNGSGQLGDGTRSAKHTPVQVGNDGDWVKVSVGDNHNMAFRSDGTLWAWGNNDNGQLGIGISGDGTEKNTPTLVGSDWSMASAGKEYTVAIRSDGTLWAWGYNGYGNLGDGSDKERHTPVMISDNDWTAVFAGFSHTVAIRSDGTLWAWGYNSNGQLGLGNSGSGTNKNIPTQVGTDDNWATASAGSSYTMAIKTDGTLWAWGYNGYGNLGDGTSGWAYGKSSPIEIGVGWTTVFAGNGHTVAIKDNNTVWTWGSNNSGQLGDGSGTNRSVPTLLAHHYTQDFNITVNAPPEPEESGKEEEDGEGLGDGNGDGGNDGGDGETNDNIGDDDVLIIDSDGISSEAMAVLAVISLIMGALLILALDGMSRLRRM